MLHLPKTSNTNKQVTLLWSRWDCSWIGQLPGVKMCECDKTFPKPKALLWLKRPRIKVRKTLKGFSMPQINAFSLLPTGVLVSWWNNAWKLHTASCHQQCLLGSRVENQMSRPTSCSEWAAVWRVNSSCRALFSPFFTHKKIMIDNWEDDDDIYISDPGFKRSPWGPHEAIEDCFLILSDHT